MDKTLTTVEEACEFLRDCEFLRELSPRNKRNLLVYGHLKFIDALSLEITHIRIHDERYEDILDKAFKQMRKEGEE